METNFTEEEKREHKLLYAQLRAIWQRHALEEEELFNLLQKRRQEYLQNKYDCLVSNGWEYHSNKIRKIWRKTKDPTCWADDESLNRLFPAKNTKF